jgi:hypothetical protein
MTDETNVAPVGGEGEAAPIAVVTPANDKPILSPREAGRALANWRTEQRKKSSEQPAAPATESQAAPAQDAPVEQPQELADEANAAPPEQEAPGETSETEPAEQPSFDPPRSWTKEAKEAFKLLPPGLQKDVAELERSREVEIRRSQNEVAEKLKGLTAKEQAAEQVRQQYEAALPSLLQALQDQQAGEFSDIKTMADVERLAREDWPRYALWDASQKKIQAVGMEMQRSQERQASEFKQKWSDFTTKEDQAFADKVPEMADPKKASALADAAVGVLRETGFSDQELAKLWNGEASISLRDHRLQLIVRDAVKLRQAQKAAKVTPKPVPPVQRPGSAAVRQTTGEAQIQALNNQLAKTGNARDAAALLVAQRRARSA